MVPNCSALQADILLPNWCCGQQAAMDVAVITPLQQQTVSEAAVTPGNVCVRLTLRKSPFMSWCWRRMCALLVEALEGWAPGSISEE